MMSENEPPRPVRQNIKHWDANHGGRDPSPATRWLIVWHLDILMAAHRGVNANHSDMLAAFTPNSQDFR